MLSIYYSLLHDLHQPIDVRYNGGFLIDFLGQAETLSDNRYRFVSCTKSFITFVIRNAPLQKSLDHFARHCIFAQLYVKFETYPIDVENI